MLIPSILLSTVLAVSGGDKSADAYYHFVLAKRALSAGDYARAINEFSQAREMDDGSAVIRTELAEVYLRLRRYRDAARVAEEAREIDPKNVEALRLLARVYENVGDTSEAIKARRELVDAYPDESEYVIELAVLLEKAGRDKEAEDLLEEAIRRSPGETEIVFKLADRYRQRGRLDRAIELLEDAAVASPRAIRLQMKLAEAYMQTRNLDGALRALGALVDLEPQNYSVLREVGRAYESLERPRLVAHVYRLALALEPDDLALRYKLAHLLETVLRDPESAIVEYRTALAQLEAVGADTVSERVTLLKRLGDSLHDMHRPEEAIASLEQARALQPSDDEVIRSLSRSYDIAGRTELSLRLVRERLAASDLADEQLLMYQIAEIAYLAVTGDEDQATRLYGELSEERELEPFHHGYVAHALLRAGRPEAGRRALQRAIELDPEERRSVTLFVARLLFEVDRTALAFEVLEELAAAAPQDRGLHAELARLYVRQDQPSEAVRILKPLIGLFSDDADLHFQLGAAYELSEMPAAAVRSLEEAIEIDPEHAFALNHLAYTWAERGEHLERSLELAKRAVALDPDNGAFLDSLGWAYFKLGRHDEALLQLERAIEQIADPVVLDHFGDVLNELGEHRRALQQFERALVVAGDELRPVLQAKIDRLRALVQPLPGGE